MPYIKPVKAGDPITEGLLNRIVDRIERFANLRSNSPYILLDSGPHGKLIELDLPVQTWALLSGSSSPYSFTEVRDGPGGTWVSMPNGDSGASNVYEINGKSGLAGKVVPITWTAAGDWRFQWVGFAPPTFAWTFNVTGCATTGIAGAVIELRQGGVLIDSCTTGDGTGGTTLGRCILHVPAGSYDITVTGPSGAGFVTNTSTASISATKATGVALAADTGSGFACWSCCNYPIPGALHSTDVDGPITLTLSIVGGIPRYTLVSTTAAAETWEAGPSPFTCINKVSPSTIRKSYTLALSSGCTAQLSIDSDTVQCSSSVVPGACQFAPPGQSPASWTVGTIAVNSGNCHPMNLVFSVATTVPGSASCGPSGPLPMPGGGGTMAFTA